MAKNAKTTPKTGQAAEPLVVSQRQIDWLHSFRIPGTDEALKSLEQAGEITFSGGVGKNRVKVPTPASPCIVSQSAVDWYKAKFPEDGATDIERWTAAGDVIITDEKTPHTRYGAVCQRCYRTIPTDANYCPYCGRPVVPVTNFPEAAPIVTHF